MVFIDLHTLFGIGDRRPGRATQKIQPLELAPGVWQMGLITFMLLGSFMIAFTSNAVNLTDGLDGLAGGTLLIAAFAMMVLTWISASQRASYFLMVPYVPGSISVTGRVNNLTVTI